MKIGRRMVVSHAAGAALALAAGMATTAAMAAAQGSSWAASRSCERGGEPRVGLGVGTYHCQGGNCLVDGIWATGSGLPDAVKELVERQPTAWDFSVEPRLWEVRTGGPAAGAIGEGAVLLAVDDMPITTRDAGRRLASMQPGAPVTLTLRREGEWVPGGSEHHPHVLQVEVVPAESCESFRVSSGPEPMPSYLEWADPPVGTFPPATARRPPARRVVRRGAVDRTLAPIPVGVSRTRFEGAGLVLAGPVEARVGGDGRVEWWFTDEAVVAEVDAAGAAGRAGIVPGEVVVSAADEPLDTPAGVAALGRAAPDRPVLLFVRRGSSARQVVIHER